MTFDRIKYEVFYRVWRVWHMRLRNFKPFMRYVPAKYYGTLPNGRVLKDPARYEYMTDDHPWWHMCCNGDTGGWRTHFCDWLERHWRSTRYYNSY